MVTVGRIFPTAHTGHLFDDTRGTRWSFFPPAATPPRWSRFQLIYPTRPSKNFPFVYPFIRVPYFSIIFSLGVIDYACLMTGLHFIAVYLSIAVSPLSTVSVHSSWFPLCVNTTLFSRCFLITISPTGPSRDTGKWGSRT